MPDDLAHGQRSTPLKVAMGCCIISGQAPQLATMLRLSQAIWAMAGAVEAMLLLNCQALEDCENMVAGLYNDRL